MISDPLFKSLIERGSGKEPDVNLEDLELDLIWSRDE